MTQEENLRDAVLKKKARIAEIERILNRPPLTEYRGRPVHGGQMWRLRLEEQRQHLLIAVAELEREAIPHVPEGVKTLEKKTLEPSASAREQGAKRGKSGVLRAGATGDPEVAKRRTLVRANPGGSAHEMCGILDRENVPLPSRWQGAGFSSWERTYKDSNYRSRIHVLISKDKHHR
jgi:hypothetical protein